MKVFPVCADHPDHCPGRKGQSFRQDADMDMAWALVWGSKPFPRFQVGKLKVDNYT